MHLKQGLVEPATVADHVVPHRGDPELFWHGRLQSLCKACHDHGKRYEEIGHYAELDANGWPIDPSHPTNIQR
jgi:5-methylcytosine-specific restriction endonuclease McrA